MDISDEENDICTQDEKKFVSEVVKAVLILDHSKKPFKQSDITKYLSKKPNRKQWNKILEKSKIKLKEMGLNLIETKNVNSKMFFLVSNMYPLRSMYRLASETEVADRTLLIIVLTFIFMKNCSVTNVDILSHLKCLNIYCPQEPVHTYFGDIKKKVFNDFVSQLYLEKVIDKESETFEVIWGERATAEVSKMSILEFVCDIAYEGSIKPKNLASYYQTALEEAKAFEQSGSQDEMMSAES